MYQRIKINQHGLILKNINCLFGWAKLIQYVVLLLRLALHRARKRFGQNFLTDERIISSIIDELNPTDGENLIEIGPGRGALTKHLFPRVKTFTAIELDRDLISPLRVMASLEKVQLEVIEQDVLSVDFSTLGEKQRVFGNLPYNISTPLMFHLLDSREHISDMHFMLQKEVAERMTATPNNKSFGQLSVNIQAAFTVEKLFDVPKEAFSPAPKVTSSIIRLKPKPGSQPPEVLATLKKVSKLAFSKRRKTLNNNFKGQLDLALLDKIGIDGSRRAESLSLEEFILLSETVLKDQSTV